MSVSDRRRSDARLDSFIHWICDYPTILMNTTFVVFALINAQIHTLSRKTLLTPNAKYCFHSGEWTTNKVARPLNKWGWTALFLVFILEDISLITFVCNYKLLFN